MLVGGVPVVGSDLFDANINFSNLNCSNIELGFLCISQVQLTGPGVVILMRMRPPKLESSIVCPASISLIYIEHTANNVNNEHNLMFCRCIFCSVASTRFSL